MLKLGLQTPVLSLLLFLHIITFAEQSSYFSFSLVKGYKFGLNY